MQSSACLMPSSGCSFTSSAAPQQCAAASLRWHVHPGGERGPGRTGLGVPGRARPEWRPAAEARPALAPAGRGTSHGCPGGSGGGRRGTGAAQRREKDGGDSAQPRDCRPSGNKPGDPRRGSQVGTPSVGTPPLGPTFRVFSITRARASSPRPSGFSQVKAAPRDASGHRSSRGAGGAHTARAVRARLPKEFFAPLTGDPPRCKAYLYS